MTKSPTEINHGRLDLLLDPLHPPQHIFEASRAVDPPQCDVAQARFDTGLQVADVVAQGVARGLVAEIHARAQHVAQGVELEPHAVGARLQRRTQVVEVAVLAADVPVGRDGVAVLAAPQEVRHQLRHPVLECRGRHRRGDGGVVVGGVGSQFERLRVVKAKRCLCLQRICVGIVGRGAEMAE